MPGLVNQAAPSAQPQPSQRAVTPESDRIVIAAKKIMAQPEVAQHLVQMMKTAADPATGIAQATIFLVKQLYEKSQGSMPPKAIVPAAQEILVDIMRLGQTAGLFKITPDLVKQAVKIAIQMFTQSVKGQEPQGGAPAQAAAPQPAAMPAQAGMQPDAQMMGA